MLTKKQVKISIIYLSSGDRTSYETHREAYDSLDKEIKELKKDKKKISASKQDRLLKYVKIINKLENKMIENMENEAQKGEVEERKEQYGEYKQFIQFSKDGVVNDVLNWEAVAKLLIKDLGIQKLNGLIMDKNFEPIGKGDLLYSITKTLKNISPKLTGEIASAVKNNIKNQKLKTSRTEVKFKNGIYNFIKQKFTPCETSGINVIQSNFIEGKLGNKWLLEVLRRYEGNNKGFIIQIMEVVGACLLQFNPWKRIVAIDGPSNTGKSFLFQDIILPALGKTNWTAFELKSLSKPTDRAKLFSRTVAYDDDAYNIRLRDVSSLKKITSGAAIVAKMLYQDEVSFINYATLVMNTNGVVDMNDMGSGGAIDNRIHIIKATVNVKEKYHDPKIYEKLEENRQAINDFIVTMGIKAFAKAWKNGQYTETNMSIEAKQQRKIDSNPVYAWLLEEGMGLLNQAGCYRASTFFEKYTKWAKEQGHEQINITRFGRGIKDHFEDMHIVKQKKSQGIFYVLTNYEGGAKIEEHIITTAKKKLGNIIFNEKDLED